MRRMVSGEQSREVATGAAGLGNDNDAVECEIGSSRYGGLGA